MSTKISELPSATSLTGTEEVPIVQTGTTKKITTELLQQAENYSTTEQVIGTWIDGKPLYRITYTFDLDGTSQSGEKVIDISSLNFDTITNLNGTTKQISTATYWRDIIQAYAYSSTAVSEYSGVFVSDNDLKFRYRGLSFTKVYITLEYTKTTD